jgi:hypothetical protein
MTIEFHPEAKQEFADAVDNYDASAPGLGNDFIAAVDEAIARIDKFPLAWPQLSANTRRCRTSRFPYGVIYPLIEQKIFIVAVMHLHRAPGYGRNRVQ